jgi:hypothetical protein
MTSRLTFTLGAALTLAAGPTAVSAAEPKPAAASGAPASAGAADAPAANKLSKQERRAGWKLLFDGKTTKGWRGYKQKTAPANWKVRDGALVMEKTEGVKGDILTVDQYESFELALDWKIAEGGNSGVMYHVLETESAPYRTGPEMQILDNARHPDAKKGKGANRTAGALYDMIEPAKDVTRPAGEWNQARLVVDGSHVEHWLNGEKLLEYEKGGEAWKALVAASKFKDWQGFGESPKGHIDLQDHGDLVAFRNIKLRVIKAAKPSVKTAAKPAEPAKASSAAP